MWCRNGFNRFFIPALKQRGGRKPRLVQKNCVTYKNSQSASFCNKTKREKKKTFRCTPTRWPTSCNSQQQQQRRRRPWLCLPSAVGGCCLGGRYDVMHRSSPDQRGADIQEEGWTSNHPSHSCIPARSLARFSPLDVRGEIKTHPSTHPPGGFRCTIRLVEPLGEGAMRRRLTPASRRRGCWERASSGRRCCW